jgi:hypothetical protein
LRSGRCSPDWRYGAGSWTIDGTTVKGEAEGLMWDRERAGPGGTRLVAPDHVGVEMAFLAVISVRPNPGPADVARRERLRWFLGHTAAWLPKLAVALGPADRATGLGRWTTWAAELVEVDLRR